MGLAGATRDLVIAAMAIVLLSAFVEGPAVWLVAALLLAAVLLATLQVLGEGVPSTAGPGVPVEALVTPGVTAVALLGSIRLVPVGILLVPAVLAGGWFLDQIVAREGRLLASASGPSTADRTAIVGSSLIVAFLAFLGAAALVPGGLPEPGSATSPSGSLLASLAGADAVVAFLLGYRAAALRTSAIRDVAWFGTTSAIVVAIASIALRTIDIPRVLGPALLVLVFFLWDAVHAGPVTRRGDQRRLWEVVLLACLGVVVVLWSVRLQG